MFDQLATPWLIYEAATPLIVWLWSEGVLPEDALTLVTPMIWLAGHVSWVSRRQAVWIERTALLRRAVHAMLGRTDSE